MNLHELYNVQTRRPETLEAGQAEEALRTGTHSFKVGSRVNVIDQEGNAQSVPAEQVAQALGEGFRLETKFQAAVNDYVEDNKGLGGALKAFVSKAGDEAALGIPGLIYDKTGDPLEVAKYEALKKEHSISAGAGAVAGFAGSLFYGGPLFKGAATAGRVAERALAERLAAAGIERGSKSMAKELVARMGTKGAQLGVEGAVISAPRAVTEAALGDYDVAAESLLYGAGIGAAFGVTGGFMGTTFDRMKKKISDQRITAANSLIERSAPVAADDALVNLEGLTEAERKSVFDGLKTIKEHTPKILEASEKLGLETLPEQVSASRFIQDVAQIVSETATLPGIQRQQKIGKAFQAYDRAIRKVVGEVTEESQAQVGRQIKSALMQQADAAAEPTRKLFQALNESFESIAVPKKSLSTIAKNILKFPEYVDRPNSAAGTLAKSIADDLMREGSVPTLERLKTFKTSLYHNLSPTASKAEKHIIGAVYEKLGELEERVIERLAKERSNVPRPGLQTAMDVSDLFELVEARRTANKQWGTLMEKLEDVGDGLGLRRIQNPTDFVNAIDRLTPEEMFKKFFTKTDSETMQLLQQAYPQQFQQIVQYQKSAIVARATKDNVINARQVVKEIGKLPKEVQGMMFKPEELDLLRHVKTHIESWPERVNPSGTSKAQALQRFIGQGVTIPSIVGAVGENVAASVAAKLVKNSVKVEGVLAAEQAMKKTATKLDEIPGALKRLSGRVAGSSDVLRPATTDALERLTHQSASRGEEPPKTREERLKKLLEKTTEFVSNPEVFTDRIAEVAGPLDELGAPNVAAVLTERMARAVQYIHESAPRAIVSDTPFAPSHSKISDAETAAFERKLSVVLDPFHAIDRLMDGSLTKDHVDALRNVYPTIYGAMKMKVLDTATDKKIKLPYKSRLKLGLLMGAETDASLSPQAMATYQATYQKAAEQMQAPPPSSAKMSFPTMAATDIQRRAMK